MTGKTHERGGVRRERLVCLTNIPTPYRLHFFHLLSIELAKRGIDFEVWFMAKSERGRYWQFEPDDFKFPHRFFAGISPAIGGAVFHLNPKIPILLQRDPPSVLLVGGAWGMPTNVLTALGNKLRRKTTILFWSESHLDSIRRKGALIDRARGWLLDLYDGFVVPGKSSLEYIQKYAPGKPVYYLLNTVDERVFKDKVIELRSAREQLRGQLGIPNGKRVLLIPARLIPEKNILPFLTTVSSLPVSIIPKMTLLIAGGGPQQEDVSSWIKQNEHMDVRLLGHVGESELLKLYAIADSFVLPSLSDPNPLSVVEALWAGLPLILSARVGNHYETLRAGKNGWLFRPESESSTCDIMGRWAATSDSELEAFGKASSAIAEEKFKTETVVRDFLAQVLN